MSVFDRFFGRRHPSTEAEADSTVAFPQSLQRDEPRRAIAEPDCLAKPPEHASTGSLTEMWGIGDSIGGDCVVRSLLGRGGMGEVWLVESAATGKQFAVKSLGIESFRHDSKRRQFMRELLGWIDLPEHPHLVACRFFRTDRGRCAIFADYVAGGSFASAIPQRHGDFAFLLDVAIQTAWALEALHSLGLVHHDVKPGNVLIAADGSARLTDFGLARARHVAGAEVDEASGSTKRKLLLSQGGMTLAYRSPQQALNANVDFRTDIWSLGVSILEGIAGGVHWTAGDVAPAVLRNLLQEASEGLIEPLPASLVEVLQRCFVREPAARWPNAASLADALADVYSEVTGSEYRRNKPPEVGLGAFVETHDELYDSITETARERLVNALVAAGGDAAEADRLFATSVRLPRTRLVMSMAALEDAHAILVNLAAAGRRDLDEERAAILLDLGSLCSLLFDAPGAQLHLDRAVDLYQGLVGDQARHDLLPELARAYVNRAVSLSRREQQTAAAESYDAAIEQYEILVYRENRLELAHQLAGVYANKGALVAEIGEPEAALVLYDRAIELYGQFEAAERCGLADSGGMIALELANTLVNRALASTALARHHEAADLYERAIYLYHYVSRNHDQTGIESKLAWAYTNSGTTQDRLGDIDRALEHYERAIELYEEADRQGSFSDESVDHLALAWNNKAVILDRLGRQDEAVAAAYQARDLWQYLVHDRGLTHLSGRLAQAHIDAAFLAGTSPAPLVSPSPAHAKGQFQPTFDPLDTPLASDLQQDPREWERIVRRAREGTPAALSVFLADQEANFRAQTKVFLAWADQYSEQGLAVLGLEATSSDHEPRYLLLKVGTYDAHWQLQDAIRRGKIGTVSEAILTEDEQHSIAPVSCYENFPQPGCTVLPDTRLDTLLASIEAGTYTPMPVPSGTRQPVEVARELRGDPEQSEQAVVIYLSLADEGYGTDLERTHLHELCVRLRHVVENTGVGEFMGTSFGDGPRGPCRDVSVRGPDADQLFATIHAALRESPLAQVACVVKCYGDESNYRSQRVEVPI